MSRSENFYSEYSQIRRDKRVVLIPEKVLMEEMLAYLTDGDMEHYKQRSANMYSNWKKRYSVKWENDEPILYHGEKRVVCYEELYDVLNKAHIETTGHGGRDLMIAALDPFYGIAKDTICCYIRQCPDCELKKARIRKSVVIKPIIFKAPNERVRKSVVIKPILPKAPNERCQLDMIDMQSQSDDGFKWILVYQDHLTKFVCLRALKSKRPDEIVFNLDRIWAQIGAPDILQTYNGATFRNSKVEALAEEWNVKMVHGVPRKSFSQGSVERANQCIENIISTFQSYFKTPKWAENLHRFQAMKNNRYHRGIRMTPYDALFGRQMKDLPALQTDERIDEATLDLFDLELPTDENSASTSGINIK